MSVEIEVLLDLTEAEVAANEFQNNFAEYAKRASEEGQSEFRKWVKSVKADLKDAAADYESFAGEARGFVGDVGDAVGQLGKGLLGLSEAQQIVADKTIYMTEKGMGLGQALGSLAGPLGTLVGTGIGAAVGGLLGYFAGNQEAATIEAQKLTAALDLQSRSVQKVVENWARADAAKKGVANLAKGWEGLRLAIDATIDKEDLSKVKTEDLNRRKKESLESLTKAQEGIGKKQQEVANIETELSRIKSQDMEDQYEKAGLIIAKEEELRKASEEFAATQTIVNGKLDEYNNVTGEIEKRSTAAAKSTKKLSEVIRDHADTLLDTSGGMGYGTEDPMQMQLDLLGFTAEMSDERVKEIMHGNELVEIAEQQHQETLSNIHMQGELKRFDEAQKRRDQEAAEIEKYAAGVNSALQGIGNIAQSAIGGLAVDAFNNWLETIATGEKDADKSFKKIAAGAIRNIGSQLVADGTKNLLTGAANILTGTPPGAPLVAIGSAEIAAGIGMGAAGAKAQRRQGYGQEKNGGGTQGNLGRAGNANNGTQVQAPTIINLGMLALTDQRHMELAGKQIAQAQRAYAQGRS